MSQYFFSSFIHGTNLIFFLPVLYCFFPSLQILFKFLETPITDMQTLSAYNIIMRRFGRADYSIHKTSLRDLTVDLDAKPVLTDLNTSLGFPLTQFTSHVGTFLGSLKDVADEISAAETILKTRVTIIEKISEHVQAILSLDNSDRNPTYTNLIAATEAYIAETIRENNLEESYKAVIVGYKKLALLQEAFMGLRVAAGTVATEPVCSVCMTDSIQYTFSPCGHTFCQGCMRKQNSLCFICRQAIREKIRLYFS